MVTAIRSVESGVGPSCAAGSPGRAHIDRCEIRLVRVVMRPFTAPSLPRLLLGAAAVAMAAVAAPATQARPFGFHADHVLGTSLDVVALSDDQATARIAMAAILADIARLDAVLSGWRGDSELARLNASASHCASADLFAVIAACERWHWDSDGRFSARVGGLIADWRAAAVTGVLPDRADLAARAAALDDAAPLLDSATGLIIRPAEVRFDVDALAKGHIIDSALAAARRAAPTLAGLMIDIGGDIRCWGQGPGGMPWRVGVADPACPADNAAPMATVALADRAIATSGRLARDVVVAGAAYAHTLDPRTGWPVETLVSATVIAPTATEADALATIFSTMTPADALAYADSLDTIAALFVDSDGRRVTSANWAHYAQATPVTANDADIIAGAPWPAGFAVTIDYEIPAIAANPYRAPYMAVWITDENRQLVRTLMLLGDSPRWIEENYVWWRRFGRKTPEIVATVAKPSRASGRYSVVWDGRDDAGKPVPQGRYTVHIEAAREHGGHAYQSAPLDLGKAVGAQALPPRDEIGRVQLNYGKRK